MTPGCASLRYHGHGWRQSHPVSISYFSLLSPLWTVPVLTSYVLFWRSIREPFRKKLSGDAEYLFAYTQGFSLLPTPAQVNIVIAPVLVASWPAFCALRATLNRFSFLTFIPNLRWKIDNKIKQTRFLRCRPALVHDVFRKVSDPEWLSRRARFNWRCSRPSVSLMREAGSAEESTNIRG